MQGPSTNLLQSAVLLLAIATLSTALAVYLLMELHYRWQLAWQARRLLLASKISSSPGSEALRALWSRAGRADREIIADILVEQCRSPDKKWGDRVQQSIVAAGILESWAQDLRRRRKFRRMQAAVRLGYVRDVRSLEALVQAATDPAGEVQLAVTLSLGRLKDWRGLPGLMRLAADPPEAIPDLTLAAALAAAGGGRADRLANLLQASGSRTRIIGAWALSEAADRTALRQLLAASQDPEPEVRAKVARALSRIPLPESIEAALRLARDPVWFVRLRALAALGQMRASSAESLALDRLQDEVREVRFRAAATLRQIRGMKGEIVREVLATRPRLSFDSLISEWERAGFLWDVVAGLSTRNFSRYVESRELLRVLVAAGVTGALVNFVLIFPAIKIRLRLLRYLIEAATPQLRADLLALAERPGIDPRVAAKVRQAFRGGLAPSAVREQSSAA
jgi:HEAT repeat protein